MGPTLVLGFKKISNFDVTEKNCRNTGVTVNNYSRKKVLRSNYLMGNNFFLSTYLLANKYSLQENFGMWSFHVFEATLLI